MVASRKVDIPLFRGVGRHCRWGFGAHAQVFGRTTIPILRKNIVPAAKNVGADFLEFAAPEIAVVVSGRKNFKTAAKNVVREILRKQLGNGNRKSTASRVIQTKTAKKISRSQRDIFTNISH